jgi:SnoaL-like domain
MPSQDVVERFVSTVVGGDFTGAIERFYVEGASMRENLGEPRVGRDGLVTHERAMMGAFKSITAECIGQPAIADDRVAIHWRFQFTPAEGSARTLEEIAWQRWDGERIVEETFFYDPSQMAA